jgi:hypothetical protein
VIDSRPAYHRARTRPPERGAGLDVPRSSCYCYYTTLTAPAEKTTLNFCYLRPPVSLLRLTNPTRPHPNPKPTLSQRRHRSRSTSKQQASAASPTSPTYICLASPKTTPRSHGTPLNTRLACRREWACEEYSTATHANPIASAARASQTPLLTLLRHGGKTGQHGKCSGRLHPAGCARLHSTQRRRAEPGRETALSS